MRLISGLALPAPSYDTPLDGEEAEEGGNEVEGVKAARRAREWRMQNEQKAMSWKEEDSGEALRSLLTGKSILT